MRGSANKIAIHGHAVHIRVPDVAETDRKLGLPTSILGAGPSFDPAGVLKAREWAVIERQLTLPPSDSCNSWWCMSTTCRERMYKRTNLADGRKVDVQRLSRCCRVVQEGPGSPSEEGGGSAQDAKGWVGGQCQALEPGLVDDRPHTGAYLQGVRRSERHRLRYR